MQTKKIYPNETVYFQSTHKCGLYLFKFVPLYWDIHFLPSVFVLICSQDSRCVLVAIMNVAQDVFRDPDGLTEIYLSGPVFHQKRYTPSSPSQLALVSIFPLQWSKYLTTDGLMGRVLISSGRTWAWHIIYDSRFETGKSIPNCVALLLLSCF